MIRINHDATREIRGLEAAYTNTVSKLILSSNAEWKSTTAWMRSGAEDVDSVRWAVTYRITRLQIAQATIRGTKAICTSSVSLATTGNRPSCPLTGAILYSSFRSTSANIPIVTLFIRQGSRTYLTFCMMFSLTICLLLRCNFLKN